MTSNKITLKKTLFALPSSLTLANIFCGFYAIVASLGGTATFYQSAVAVFIASIFDMFDGKIARITKTQSDFGTQIDSIADIISFGMAPIIIAHKSCLGNTTQGSVVSFAFLACGSVRLAKYNTLKKNNSEGEEFFSGLPIPIAANMLILTLATCGSDIDKISQHKYDIVICATLMLAALMVSDIKFWSFKKSNLLTKKISCVVFVAVILVSMINIHYSMNALFVFLLIYIALPFLNIISKNVLIKNKSFKCV